MTTGRFSSQLRKPCLYIFKLITERIEDIQTLSLSTNYQGSSDWITVSSSVIKETNEKMLTELPQWYFIHK